MKIDELLKMARFRTVDWSNVIFKPIAQRTFYKRAYFEFPDRIMREEYHMTTKDVWLAGFYRL